MIESNTFDILLLISRPAAGKSEIIDHLKHIEINERTQRFHVGAFEVIDDFPMLWTWFEEDSILDRMGYPRLHTTQDRIFVGHHLWDLLIQRICLEYRKLIRDDHDFHRHKTAILEFSRGSEHGGYTQAFNYLSYDVVEKMAILYINVSWEESRRKNRARFNPDRPDSILEHGLSDKKLYTLYRHNDWDEVSKSDSSFITIHGIQVPYVVFENEDDITTQGGEALSDRLEGSLDMLWHLYEIHQLAIHNDKNPGSSKNR